MVFPEDVQQSVVGDAPGIKIHLHRFRVVADVAVIRIVLAATGVTHPCANYAFDYPEPGFDSPESPQAEGCGLKNCRGRRIDGRDCRRYQSRVLCARFMAVSVVFDSWFACESIAGEQAHRSDSIPM